MSGSVVHFELPADEPERAHGFYREAFGWQIQTGAGGYSLASTTPCDESGRPTQPGAVNGGILARQHPVTNPVLTIDVPDIESALATIESLGGSTLVGKQDVMGMGFSAYFTDTEGNVMGLWQNAS